MTDLTIEQVLSDHYCARCDSYGHTERRDSCLWCNCCWKICKPVPRSVQILLRKLVAKQ